MNNQKIEEKKAIKTLDERKKGIYFFTENFDDEYDEEFEKSVSLSAYAEIDTKFKVQGIMRTVLISCTLNKDYRLLKKMYKECLINNHELVEKSEERRLVVASPTEAIFMDLTQVLYDKAVEDPSVLDLFYENSKKIFSDSYKKYLKLKELYKRDGNWKHYYDENTEEGCVTMLFFLCYEDDIKDSQIDDIVYDQLQKDEDWIKTRTAQFTNDDTKESFVFNTGEEVLPSSQYEKYLKRKRGELAEYANDYFNVDHLTDENIGDFLQEHLIAEPYSGEGERIGLPADNSYISIVDAMEIVVAQNGVREWFTSMISDDDFDYGASLHYKPNVDELINIHFKNCALKEFCYCTSNGEQFCKLRLVRDCDALGIEEDLNAILYMYNMDVICKMFNQMKEEYYLNFSWGETDNKEIEARYEARSKEMQDTIDELNQKLEDEKQKRIAIKEETDKSKKSEINKLASGYKKEINENNKKLKKKDKEIAELKKQIALKDEYIEILSAEEEESDMEWKADITSLQQKRYLFVGYIDNLPELKRLFPNSVFMDTPQKSLTGIKVDAVVLLVKYMSHKMYYKVKNTASLADLRIIKCNATNIDGICNTMALAVA